ncbi:hypothetical protein BDD12DRAFT_830157 [Trichophaea hybrida]|nr:hypothetical protein BDD12DRAFT_830157 [Trichophaea hybrida]
MDTQKAWDTFIAKLNHPTKEEIDQKYLRMDVEFPNLPDLDSVEHLPHLISEAERFCHSHKPLIRNIANKLIASLFYLQMNEVKSMSSSDHSHHRCTEYFVD